MEHDDEKPNRMSVLFFLPMDKRNLFVFFFIANDGPTTEPVHSISQLAMGFGKRPTNETLAAATAGMVHSDSFRSFHDIFTTQTPEQAKDLIMNGVRHEINRIPSRATSESGSEDYIINRIDPVDLTATPTIVRVETNQRKPTMLLAGPNFRLQTVEPEFNLKRDTIYPVAVGNRFSYVL